MPATPCAPSCDSVYDKTNGYTLAQATVVPDATTSPPAPAPTPAPTPVPASPVSSGSGGGAPSLWFLLLLVAAWAIRLGRGSSRRAYGVV